MKISVFVPCVPNHWENIQNIVNAYNCGTVKPDEIIVLISDCTKIKNRQVNGARIVPIENPMYAGPARQRAVGLCRGDIIMYQDSDDIPHKARVEIIKGFFENHKDAVMVNHSYCYKKWDNEIKMDYKVYNAYNELYKLYFPDDDFLKSKEQPCYGAGLPFMVHAGVPSVKRSLLYNLSWKAPNECRIAPEPKTKSEDMEFCMEALYKMKAAVYAIDTKPYLYTG